MKLRKLSIRRMPGFEEKGFEMAGLSDGLNVITGPNASGKTTACRAIRGLLWPETLGGASPVSVAAEWADKGPILRVELERRSLMCQRDGLSCEMPPLPGAHVAGCFTVTVDDLFTGSETDGSLAERAAREMAGGYDLNAVRRLDVFDLPRTHGRKDLKEFENAKKEARRITTDQQALRTEEEELGRIEKQEKEARMAQARLASLAEARNLVEVRAEISKAGSILEGCPEGMELLSGDEEKRLEQIRSDLARASEDLNGAANAEQEATQMAKEANLPEGRNELLVEEQKARIEALRKTEAELDDSGQRASEADEKVKGALRAFGAAADPEKLDCIDPGGLDEIDAFHRSAEDIKAHQAALQSRLALLGKESPQGNVDALVSGINILRQWFESGHIESRGHCGQLAVTWLVILLIAGIGVALAFLMNGWWILLLLPAGLAAAASWFMRKPVSTDMGKTLQGQYGRLPLDAPVSWDRETVGRHLNALECSLAEARAAERDGSQRKNIEVQLERLEEETRSVEQQRVELAGRFGVSPDTSPLALSVLATNVLRYQEGRTARDVLCGRMVELRQKHVNLLEAIGVYLGDFGETQCDSYDMARVRSEAIEKRVVQHREAGNNLAVAQREVASAEKRIGELENRKRQFFADIGMEGDGDAVLRERLAILADYREAVDKSKELKAGEAALVSRLEHVPGIQALTIEQIHTETEQLQKMADSDDDLIDRITDIRSRVDSTVKELRLENALADVERARGELADRLDESTLAAAGEFLLSEVEAEYEVESRPAVLQQASRWFGMFTRGRYELRIDGIAERGALAFRALDTVTGRGLALGELSRGSRMQLLLAVRLAFAVAAEQGVQLPFILDEALSSTDPVRFRAIIECILAMVKEGRQVLYFTCQPGDALAWHVVAEEMGIRDARKIDLADIPVGERVAAEPLARSAAETKRLPEPKRMELSEYVEVLGIRELDPTAGARAAHLAHFVGSAGDLHRLVSAGIETYGQLESLASHGSVDAYVANDTLLHIRACACLVDAFSEAWGIGRGKPVSREVLLAAGVSDSFIDRVAGIARDLDWDAKQLLGVLRARGDERAKGFRADALERVTGELAESCHLDMREPLDEDAVQVRVLSAVNDFIKEGVIEASEARERLSRLYRLSASGEWE